MVANIVSETFTIGTFIPDPDDPFDYNNQIVGLAWISFDSTSGAAGAATPRVFVGVANKDESNIFISEDAGATCM